MRDVSASDDKEVRAFAASPENPDVIFALWQVLGRREADHERAVLGPPKCWRGLGINGRIERENAAPMRAQTCRLQCCPIRLRHSATETGTVFCIPDFGAGIPAQNRESRVCCSV